MKDAQIDHLSNRRNDDDAREPEVELLITRILDDEATQEDRARFERVADIEPALWRTLALRQQDMLALTCAVEDAIVHAERVELPAESAARRKLSWPLALSGWAAVLIVALWLGVIVSQQSVTRGGGARAEFTPVDHYQQYVRAPFVLGERQPVVLEIDELPDGRVALRFLRRIEEVAFLDPDDLPVDENGELTKSLPRLRAREPQVRIWN